VTTLQIASSYNPQILTARQTCRVGRRRRHEFSTHSKTWL